MQLISILLYYKTFLEIDMWTVLCESTQPCGLAAVRTAKTGLSFLDTIFWAKRLVVLERKSLSKAGQGLLLPDVDLVPHLRDRGAGDGDGCADLAHHVDGVGGITLAVGVVDLSAPECASLVAPLAQGFDCGLLVVTHGVSP